MSNEPDIDKRQIGLRADLDLCRKVEKKYGRRDDESRSVAYIRALEDATRNVRLTADDYDAIAAEARANLERRMAKRRAK